MDEVDESVGTKFSCEDCIAFVEDSETVGFAIVALDGTFVCVNPAYCKIFNATWRQVIGTTYEEWTHPKDLEADKTAAKELADGLAMKYGIFKTYIQRGSTDKHPREISGFLEVEAVWKDGKCQKYRVKFSPYGQTELPKTSLLFIKDLLPALKDNWKYVIRGILILVSIFGGSELATRILSVIAQVKGGGALESPP